MLFNSVIVETIIGVNRRWSYRFLVTFLKIAGTLEFHIDI